MSSSHDQDHSPDNHSPDNRQNDDDFIIPAEFTPLEKTQAVNSTVLNYRKLTIFSLLLIFVLVLVFIFSTQSVQISVSPPSSDIDIDGGLSLPINGRYLMLSGDYRATARARGYHSATTSFKVEEKQTNRVEISLQKKPGLISVTSAPNGAVIIIDGQEHGTTPKQKLQLQAGHHQIKLLAERYRPQLEELIVSGMGIHQQLDYTLMPAWAKVLINSDPAGAEILIDGEPVGRTPMSAEILEGKRQLSLQLIGYKNIQTELTVSAGNHQDLGTTTLQREDGLLRLKTEPGAANVVLNGVYQGKTPIDIPLSPSKEHTLVVFKPGYHNWQKSLSLGNSLIKEFNLSLKPVLAKVRLSTQPGDTEILINGKPYPRSTRSLELPSHEHSLEIRKVGYQPHFQKFTPKPGLEQLISIRLRTKEQARLAALKPVLKTSSGQTLKLFSPGSLTMGASRREPGRRSNEVLYPVQLNRLFYLATHEVTNKQFFEFQAEHQSGQVEGNNLEGDNQPVVKISWLQAAQYCNWLSQKEGLKPVYIIGDDNSVASDYSALGYRLPTEAEWAWASRSEGGKMLKFPWGGSLPPPDNSGNYADKNSAFITRRAIAGYTDKFIVSAPVGSFPANTKGLYDMGGNVAEWINDYYGIPSNTGQLLINPTGPSKGHNWVIRGSSWAHGTITELRLSYRDYGNQARDDVGFRLARYAE